RSTSGSGSAGAAAGTGPGAATGPETAAAGTATGWGTAIWTSWPALRTRTFRPSCSISNSARSCSRTRSRTFLISSRFIGRSDEQKVAGYVGQHLASFVGHYDVILQPHAANSRNVRSRFDRADHPGAKPVPVVLFFVITGPVLNPIGAAPNPGRLVHVEAKPVAGCVEEGLAKPVGLEYLARRRIHFRGKRLCAHRRERGHLCGPHRLEQCPGLCPDLPDSSHPGKVAAVSVQDAAKVQHDQVALLQPPIGRTRVRQRTVGTGSDDRFEGRPRQPGASHRAVDVLGDLAFAPARTHPTDQFPCHSREKIAAPANPPNFVR